MSKFIAYFKALCLSLCSIFILISEKINKWFILLAHPFIFCLTDLAASFYFDQSDSTDHVMNFSLSHVIAEIVTWENKIFLSEYSNMYTLIMYSALPIWSALYVVALSDESSIMTSSNASKSDQSSKLKFE